MNRIYLILKFINAFLQSFLFASVAYPSRLTELHLVFMQPPPAPRARSKLDSLIYLPESVKAPKLEDDVSGGRSQFSLQEGRIEKGKEIADQEIEVDAEPENIERPVDLYKVFSLLLFKSVVKVYSSLLEESVLAKFSLIWTIMS